MRKRSRRRRRILVFTLGGGAVALVLIAYVVLPLVVAPIVRTKLQSLVSNHLRAELKLADLSYRFPYTVAVTDARIVTRDGLHAGHELLRLERGRITLDELPLGKGPLRIKSIDLDRPALYVLRDASGDVVGGDMLRKGGPKPDERITLSDLFRLRKLTLRGGKVTFKDRTRPDAPPMVWDNLTTDLAIAPREAALYEFRYRAGGAPLAELAVEGTIDIDRLVMEIDRLALTGRADPGADASAVPAFVYEFVQKHQIAGAVRVEGGGTVPLRDPQASSFKASIHLDGARAHVYRYDRTLDRLDLELELEKKSAERAIGVRVPALVARAAPAEVTLAQAQGAVDWAAQTWRLSVPHAQATFSSVATSQPATMPASAGSIALALDAAGSLDRGRVHWDRTSGRVTLDDVTLQLPRFPQALEHVSGNLAISEGVAVVERLVATYGADVWTFASGRVDLTNLPDRFEVTDVAGAANFAPPPSPVYPKGFGKVTAALRPQGLFSFTGGFARDRQATSGSRTRWDFVVNSDGGAFTLTRRDIALTAVRGEAHVTRDEVEIRSFLANVCDGALAATGTIDPRKPVSYRGEVSVENVDLRALVEQLRGTSSESKYTVTGRLGGSAMIESDGGTVEMLRASGELVVHDGVLWEVPVLSDVVGEVKVARDALTAGEAAAVVEMKDGVIHVRRAAVSSSALGLQGGGTIDLRDDAGDRALDLDVVAAPLGDWEKHLKKTGVPIVSDVAGALAGAMQKAFNTATSTLLYEFRVTGHLSKPHLSAVAAPVLTEAAASVFEGMLRHEKDLMKSLRGRGRRDEGK